MNPGVAGSRKAKQVKSSMRSSNGQPDANYMLRPPKNISKIGCARSRGPFRITDHKRSTREEAFFWSAGEIGASFHSRPLRRLMSFVFEMNCSLLDDDPKWSPAPCAANLRDI